jgi:ABC-type transport system substrate-binding protein
VERNYWSDVLKGRIRRRRVLALSAAGAGAAFLAACGGDGSSDGESGGTGSALVEPAKDTFAQAKRGGVLKDYAQAEPRSLDPLNPQADYNRIAPFVYNTLLSEKPGYMKPSAYEIQGQLAESYEVSQDGLQLTMKLRQGVKWHNRPPVNGRVMDADDVIFSLNRFAQIGPLASLIFNSASPDAPVLSTTATDRSTVVMKLKDPVVYMPNWFADFGSFTGLVIMFPKEANGGFDLRNEIIGSGPFMLKEHTPSVSFTLARNPDFWDKDYALVDELQMPIVPEYAARLSQLKAGNVHYAISTNTLRAEDTLTLKRDEPRILLYDSEFATTTQVWTFGHLPIGQNKFQDERVRQAVSMSFDRDLFIESKYNVETFRAEGIPIRTGWNSHLANRDSFDIGGWFLDPQKSEFGPNAKYFEYNLAEAKKLMSAAGFANGFDVTVHYPASLQYNLSRDTEPMLGFIQELGLRVKQDAQTDYTADYIPNNRDGNGKYEGIGIHSVTGSTPSVVSPTSALVAEHLPGGVPFHGYDINGKGDMSGDPALTAILAKARVEKDVEAQKKLVLDAQRYLGKANHSLSFPGGATGLWAAWPAVQNFRVYSGVSTWERYKLWVDTTKAPFA